MIKSKPGTRVACLSISWGPARLEPLLSGDFRLRKAVRPCRDSDADTHRFKGDGAGKFKGSVSVVGH